MEYSTFSKPVVLMSIFAVLMQGDASARTQDIQGNPDVKVSPVATSTESPTFSWGQTDHGAQLGYQTVSVPYRVGEQISFLLNVRNIGRQRLLLNDNEEADVALYRNGILLQQHRQHGYFRQTSGPIGMTVGLNEAASVTGVTVNSEYDPSNLTPGDYELIVSYSFPKEGSRTPFAHPKLHIHFSIQ